MLIACGRTAVGGRFPPFLRVFLRPENIIWAWKWPTPPGLEYSGTVSKEPVLSVVRGSVAAVVEPPVSLGKAGRKLWRSVTSQYDIRDAGGLAILEDACLGRDRSTEYRAVIDQEGATIRTKSGIKEHPLVKFELAERAFTCRQLQRLGLDVEALRGVGRPGGRTSGVTWEQLRHADEENSN